MRVLNLFLFLISASCSPTKLAPDGGKSDDANYGDPCQSALNCDEPLFCSPKDMECTDALPCVGHSDCGIGGYCNSGNCARADTGTPCDGNDDCLAPEECQDQTGNQGKRCGCNAEFFEAVSEPPNILFLMDRSSSMLSNSKWTQAKAAVNTIAGNYAADAQMGMLLYPTKGSGCSVQGSLNVPVANNTSGAISTALNNNAPDSSAYTPILSTLEAVVNGGYAVHASGQDAVILLTDGHESCASGSSTSNDQDTVAAVQSLANNGVLTFAIGFTTAADTQLLDAIAAAGGTGMHYPADDQQALVNAIATIIGSILPCEYSLSGEPQAMEDIFVYVNGVEQTTGWSYNSVSNSISFDQMTCDSLRNMPSVEVDVVTGCPGVIPE